MFKVLTLRECESWFATSAYSSSKNTVLFQHFSIYTVYDWLFGVCPSSQIYKQFISEIGFVSFVMWQDNMENPALFACTQG